MTKPTLLIISATIRRDLHRPFRRFKKFRVVHAYMDAAYGDLDQSDLAGVRQYHTPADLAALIAEVKPNLIQAPEPVASRTMLRAAWVVWRWCRSTNTPYFFPMFENLPLHHKFGPVVGRVMAAVLRRFARDAAWIYVLNEGALRTLQSLGIDRPPFDKGGQGDLIERSTPKTPPAPLSERGGFPKIIRANWGNWGLDRSEFRPARKPATARVDHPVVLFVGRMSHAKGVDTLLQAFAIVRSTLPTAELWLVGPAKLDPEGEKLTAETVHLPGVQFLGPKKQRLLPAIFHKAWVTVLLSRTTKRWAEQVGMVNLQSLACGTPVVTTTSGSIREYLKSDVRRETSDVRGDTGNGALLVPEGDADAAAQAILAILHDPKQRETMGRAGVAWVQQTFDEAKNVPRLERDLVVRLRDVTNGR